MGSKKTASSARSISVIGLGKLGAPIAACFADKGNRVIGVDVNANIIRLINEGKPPVFETGLEEIMKANRQRLSATTDYEEAVLKSEITFIIVPTPTDKTGGFSLRYVLEACEKIGQALKKKKEYHMVALSSTVLPGSTDDEVRPMLEKSSGKVCGRDFGLCYNPEFIALGSLIKDVLNPDFVLIGESDSKAGEILESFYKTFCDNKPPIARMSPVNAEITKLSVNTFVTTKITFANMIARICERLPGANVDVVTSALGLDKRIGRKYLKGATGYGGPCFPRDNLALSYLARKVGAPATLAEATDKSNRMQIANLVALLKANSPKGGTVGILGLTYKPFTDVVEEAQGLLLAQALAAENIPVVVYDPAGMENARKVLKDSVKFAKSLDECIKKSSALALTTPWEEFTRITPKALRRAGARLVVIDCWRMIDSSKFGDTITYIALGIGA